MWCVYAIGSSVRGPVNVTGLAGERLTVVRAGSLAAYAGEMRRIPRPAEDQLRKYDAVQRRLAARASALLPARYGTEVRDLEELEVILRSRQATLRRQLAKVRGRVQMTTRLLDTQRLDTPRRSRTLAPAHRHRVPSHPRTGAPCS